MSLSVILGGLASTAVHHLDLQCLVRDVAGCGLHYDWGTSGPGGYGGFNQGAPTLSPGITTDASGRLEYIIGGTITLPLPLPTLTFPDGAYALTVYDAAGVSLGAIGRRLSGGWAETGSGVTATDLLDAVDAIEPGITLRGAQRAALAVLSGMMTPTLSVDGQSVVAVSFLRPDGRAAITIQLGDGGRTGVTVGDLS